MYLRETVRGTDETARRTARKALNRLVVEAEKARWLSSVVSLGHVIDEWLRVAEHEDSTRETSVIEHKAEGEHDCTKAKCAPHVCKPMAASTVRQIHSVISGALSMAVCWDWLESNPARLAQRPKQKPPEPDPPSPAEAAKLVDEACRMDADWGTLVWLVMTTRDWPVPCGRAGAGP